MSVHSVGFTRAGTLCGKAGASATEGVTCDACLADIARAMGPRVGDYVMLWFDTGALGASPLYGLVTRAGKKTFDVMWESHLSNRVRYTEPRGVKRVPASDLDERALAALAKHRG